MQEMTVDVRVIAATHRDLKAMIEEGRFRQDLYYRLDGITLDIPPLRSRRDEIQQFWEIFRKQANKANGRSVRDITTDAMEMLASHDWPGNVRELRNVVETLCLLKEGRQVRPADLPDGVRPHAPSPRHGPGVEHPSQLLLELDDGLEALTRQIIEAALEADEGSTVRAAARLKVSPRTLQRHVAAGRVRLPEHT
jgi:DNA-binding NtrC family response regulator